MQSFGVSEHKTFALSRDPSVTEYVDIGLITYAEWVVDLPDAAILLEPLKLKVTNLRLISEISEVAWTNVSNKAAASTRTSATNRARKTSVAAHGYP